MLGMGATLTGEDFKDVVREPRSVTIGIIVQLLLVPLIAFVFIQTTGLVGGVAVGVALIAAIPGGTTSNIFTYMARGNVPLSISITGLTTLACLLTTPLILSLLITEYLPAGFTMPTGQIINEIALTLLLPLSIGMLLLRYLPKHAGWISKWSVRLSLLAILGIVVGSSSAGRLNVEVFGNNNMLLIAAFLVLLTIISWFSSRLLGLSTADSTAIEMEVIVRNVNLGVLLKASLFPVVVGSDNQLGDMVLFSVLLYGGLQMIVAAVLIVARRRQPVV
jgi:BASS family bile acid:Na+ symporter